MKKIILDGKKMNNNEVVHDYLALMLDTPEYTGKNLDALWDTLSSYDRNVEIKIINADFLIKNLGEYGEKILKMFLEAEKQQINIDVEIESY